MIAEAIIGHMVGDFLLQNDWQATQKKKCSLACSIHCILWTIAVLLCSFQFNPWLAIWLFVSHFAIDRTGFIAWWMHNVSGQRGFAENLKPWSIIIVDQAFHLLTILVGFKFIG